MTVASACGSNAAPYPALYLGSFALTGLRFTIYRHVSGAVAVYLIPAGTDRAHRVGVLHGITDGVARAEFEHVQEGATVLFDPLWPLADLVFAQALQIGASR